MGTTADKLNKLIETKSAIRQAIIDKGGEVSEDTIFADYPARIKAIEHDFFYNALTKNGTDYSHLCEEFRQDQICDFSKYDTSQVRTMYSMFYNCKTVTSLNVSNWDTGKVTNMSYMFYDCNSLTSLDVSNWNTSNVTNISCMFYDCNSLTSLDLSNWNTKNVTDMYNMFHYCSSLTTVGDISNWNVSDVTSMYSIFVGCSALTSLDLSNWDMSNVTSMDGMFSSCSALASLKVSKWNTSKVTGMDGMFNNCSSLTELNISNWDTSKVKNMNSLFKNCENLTTVIGELDLSNLTKGCYESPAYKMFNNNPKLGTIYLKNIYKNCAMTDVSKWSIDLSPTIIKDECLRQIISELPDLAEKGITNNTNIILTLPPTNTLTESDIQVAIDKGWIVSNT